MEWIHFEMASASSLVLGRSVMDVMIVGGSV